MDSGLAFLLSVVLNVIATRIWKDIPPFMTFLAIAMMMSIGLSAWFLWIVDGDPLDMAASLLVYIAGVEFYVLFILLVAYSVSASILTRTLGRPLSSGDLTELYSDEKMLAMRLTRLRSLGLIVEINDRATITPAGYRLLYSLDRVRRFFGHNSTL